MTRRNEFYRLGIEYLLSLELRGVKGKIADCADIDRGNFSNMLRGNRPFPEDKLGNLAKCMGLSIRDIERVGMDLHAGVEDSVHVRNVIEKKIIMPIMSAQPDLNVYAVDADNMKSNLVGEGWTLDDGSIMAQFEKQPLYQARYIFKSKLKDKYKK